jgi:opacity protein-like surface antigen
MHVMKKTTFVPLVVSLSIVASSLSLWAVPSSSNDPFEYLVRGRDLSKLSIGLYAMQSERDITWDASGITETLKADHVRGYLGYDIFNAVTIYAVGGSSESKFGDNATADSDGEYGVGIRANVLNHFIRETTPMEDAIRVNLGAQYLRSSADTGGTSVDWDEISVSLTLGLVNHTEGNKYYTPESYSIYVGPIYSKLNSDDFEAKDDVGLIAGMEVFLTDTIVVDFEVQNFENTSVAAGINFRF